MPPTRARETNPGHPQLQYGRGGRQSPLRTRESPSPILTDDDDADEETISQDDDEEDDDDEQETTSGSSS